MPEGACLGLAAIVLGALCIVALAGVGVLSLVGVI